MHRLKDKVAIITGASGGIGQSTAQRFLAEGAKVMLVDVDEVALQQTAATLAGDSSYCVADVSNESDTQAYVAATLEQFGRIDILLANAGIEGVVAPISEYDEAIYDRVMAVNVKGAWLGIKHVFPVMQRNGGGSITITSSIAGVTGAPAMFAYSTSKHAVIGLMRSAAIEGAPHNIRVNTVNPSPVETRMMRSIEAGMNPDDSDAIHQLMTNNIPLGRYGESTEIANLFLFLSSDEAAFLTGSVYMADGGSNA